MRAPGSDLSRWCSRIQEGLWLTAALAVPLAINPWGSNVFELPKTILLRALVLFILAARLAQELADRRPAACRRFRWAMAATLWPVLALALSFALATLLSTNPRASLWGSYERQQGLLTWGAYLALFLLIATGARARAQVERLWLALVWGSVPVVGYGLVQAAGLDPLPWHTDAASAIVSTIGRANFVGSYLVLLLPLTLGRALLARLRCPYLLLLAGQLACVALTQARGAWLGVAAAAVGFGLIWAATTRRARLAIATVALALLALGLVAALNVPGSPLAPLAQAAGLGRLATLAQTDAGSTAARLTTWRATLPLIADRPVLGYGPETMRPVFYQVFPPELVYYQGRDAIVDRAHNLWLDLGMSAGVAGVVAYGLVLAGFCWMAWQALRQGCLRWERLAWTAIASSIIGHVVDLQFGFDLTASATVFWMVLAMGAALAQQETVEPCRHESTAGPSVLLPCIALGLAGLVLVGLFCARPLLADIAYKESQGAGSLADRVSWGKRSLSLWPSEPEYHMGAAWTLMQGKDWTAAEAHLATASSLSPNDAYVWLATGELYANRAQAEPAYYRLAEAAYRQAVILAPTVARHRTALGLVLVQQGQTQEGVTELERAIDLDATDALTYRHLSDLYRRLGRDAEAHWAEVQAIRWSEE
jgi:O-antigen ligase